MISGFSTVPIGRGADASTRLSARAGSLASDKSQPDKGRAWSQPDERILLVVSDSKTGDAFSVDVEPGDALEAFHHPYSYAAFKRAA
jgi:hypothetical protein